MQKMRRLIRSGPCGFMAVRRCKLGRLGRARRASMII